MFQLLMFPTRGDGFARWCYGVQCLMDVFIRRGQLRDQRTFL